jgi:thiamine pyrophosphokinase
VTIPAPGGAVVSLLPLTSFVRGVVTTGLQYPLPAPWDAGSATLPLGSARGVSNVVRDAPVTVSITQGVLLVVWGNVP